MAIKNFDTIISEMLDSTDDIDGFMKRLDEFVHSFSPKKKADFYVDAGLSMVSEELYDLGLELFSLAVDYYNTVDKRTISNQTEEDIFELAEIYLYMERCHHLAGRIKEAKRFNRKILYLASLEKSYEEQFRFFYTLGFVCSEERLDEEKAIYFYKKAMKVAAENNDKGFCSSAYDGMGLSYNHLGQPRRALYYHRRSLQLVTELKDDENIMISLNNIGTTCREMGKFKDALSADLKALELAVKLNNFLSIAGSNSGVGQDYLDLGQIDTASQYLEKALSLAKKAGNNQLKAQCYGNLSNLYQAMGKTNKALQYTKRSIDLYRKIKDYSGISKSYASIGLIHDDKGDYMKAVHCHEKALKLNTRLNDIAGQANDYSNLGSAYSGMCNFRKAIAYYHQGYALSKSIGNREGMASQLINLCGIYFKIGDYSTALAYNKKALRITVEIKCPELQSICFSNAGLIYRAEMCFDKAIKNHNEALKIDRKLKQPMSAATDKLNLGTNYFDLGKLEEARAFLKTALSTYKKIGARDGIALCLFNIASIDHKEGRMDKAIERLQEALEISGDIGDISTRRHVNFLLGQIYVEKKPVLALDYMEKSVEEATAIGDALFIEEHQLSFFRRLQENFTTTIKHAVKQDEKARAIKLVEGSKSRAFNSLLMTSNLYLGHELMRGNDLLKQEKALLRKLKKFKRHGYVKTLTPVDSFAVLEELNTVYEKMKSIAPEYVAMRTGVALNFKQMQELL